MNSTIALNVQRRINALDSASILAIVLALASYASPLITTIFLISCLFCQAIVFRSYFKYINDSFRLGKRVTFIVAICIAIIALILNRGLV
jgi:heme/copper-type cytochrome/quinol oxidase subunit 4